MKTLTLVALVAVLGCKSDEAPKPKPPPVPTDGIELVTPGTKPHQPLRYHLRKGTRTPLQLAMDLELVAGARNAVMPTMETKLDIVVDDVLPDGSARIRWFIHSAAARERAGATTPVDQLDAQAALLGGLSITATLAPGGRLSDSKVDTTNRDFPATLAEQVGSLSQNLEQVAMQLPDAPVGVGAIWKNRKTVQQNNLSMVTVTTIRVTAIDGDRFSFTSESEVTGADQTVKQGDVSIDIKDISGIGTGKGIVDLSSLAMHGDFSAVFESTVLSEGQAAPMKTIMSMRLTPRPDTPTETPDGSAGSATAPDGSRGAASGSTAGSGSAAEGDATDHGEH